MRALLYILTFLLTTQSFAQKSKAEDFGFRHFQVIYKGDTVDILVKSKNGEDQKRKPIFLFCQGSLPQPLIKKDGDKLYGVFPFETDSLETDYHIAIVSKPFIPLIVEAKTLGNDFCYLDPTTGKFPKQYSERNLLDYYVGRNLKAINFLEKQSFV